LMEESHPNEGSASGWKAYLKSLRRANGEGGRSERINAIASGLILDAGIIVSIADLVFIQRMSYHFDLVTVAGLAFLSAGLGLRVLATRTLGRYFSPAVRVLPEHRLVKSGVYRLVRNPIYLGTLLAFFSVPLLFHSLFGLLVMALKVPFTVYRIRVEERALLAKFGDEFREYMKTSKRLIPYVY